MGHSQKEDRQTAGEQLFENKNAIKKQVNK